MRTSVRLLKFAGAGVAMLGIAALVVLATPSVFGQVSRERPLTRITTHVLGGPEIGAKLRDVDDADVRRERLPDRSGAVIDEVEADGPAAEAGFRAGDVVVTFDKERVRSARHLARLIEETPIGGAVAAEVIRNGNRMSLSVAPEANEGFGAFAPLRELQDFGATLPERFDLNIDREPFIFSMPSVRSRARLGVTITDLSDQLAEYFQASAGVLVTSVDEDTPAARAGLKAGDVITKVGTEAVRSVSDLQRRVASASGEMELTIVRDRREQTLRVPMETATGSDSIRRGTAIRK
jgi:S1-C subfamily serine protease